MKGNPSRAAPPSIVAVETTKRCNLRCIHCRALADGAGAAEELSTDEMIAFFDDLARAACPLVILTGGEPLLREDIFTVARHGTELGFTMTMAPNGTLMDREVAKRMIEAGIRRISISLDGATADVHDVFRDMPGAFEGAMKGIEAARSVGLPFQINTSVTAFNSEELPRIHELAGKLHAAAHHVFMLVRVGRGRELDAEVPPAEQERILNWLYERHREGTMSVRATCAPHYFRILTQRGGSKRTRAVTRGCLAGRRFVFVSSTGIVQPCGYLDVECGNLRQTGFWEIWKTSPVLNALRSDDALRGKCGVCDYRTVCGGCRARAYAAAGDYLAEEPACLYRPPAASKA